MTFVEQRILDSWNDADRVRRMNRTVEELAAEGVTRNELDEALGTLLNRLYDEKADEDTIDFVYGIGDRLHGWCLPECHIHSRDGSLRNGRVHTTAPVTAQ